MQLETDEGKSKATGNKSATYFSRLNLFMVYFEKDKNIFTVCHCGLVNLYVSPHLKFAKGFHCTEICARPKTLGFL